MNKGMFSSNKDDWETPQNLFDELNRKYHFTLDPCCSHDNAKCEQHYTKDEDGLSKSWENEVVFVNPPYGREISKWVEKCDKESHHATIVALLPARTDTRWFHDFIYGIHRVKFIKGRLKFEVGGEPLGPAPFPSMLVFF